MAPHEILERMAENDLVILSDPGDAGTISVGRRYDSHVKIVTAAAETRTLADPAFPGQHLTLSMMTDGGDCTVTASSAVDEGGNTVITFSEAGQMATFVAVATSTTANAWRLVAVQGTAVPASLAIPMYAFQEADGTALADFVDGASTTPGYADASEISGIRWNNHATPDPISASIPYPADLDPTRDVTVHLLAAKTGATLADAVTWDVTAFENVDGALYDADADFGGTSSAMTGDATAKTVQEETVTLSAADITGSPGAITLTIQPTDGTLGTDDVILIAVWLEYTRKILAT